MKNLIISIIFLVYATASAHQDPDACLFDLVEGNMENIGEDQLRYTIPGWGQGKNEKVAIVYIDFPDGRWNDNGVMKQPYTTSELALVPNKDAAGEVGLTFDASPFPVGGLYMNASKYSWYDRWNMFFSQTEYYDNSHPDWATHGDSAYGRTRTHRHSKPRRGDIICD